MATRPDIANGPFQLDLGGQVVGALRKFSGLGLQADIASQPASGTSASATAKKHVAGMRFTPARATVGVGMGKAMADWIRAAFDKGATPMNGTFKAADFNQRVTATRSFTNALITEVTVPRLDGASKEPLLFDIGFEAERVELGKGGGETIGSILGLKPKLALASNFRIEIGKLPCERVVAVDAFTWKCAVVTSGTRRITRRMAAATVPDLKLSIAAADYPAWAEAATKWFIQGESLEAQEMAGRIVFLAANLRDELGSIELSNVGFKRFDHPEAEAGTAQVARFNVELYVEAMSFNIKG
jgi:hypothetical protein